MLYRNEVQSSGELMPRNPSFDAGDLQRTPEMEPRPYYPGQDIRRDQYIRSNPASGVAQRRINRYGDRPINIRGTDIPDVPRNRYNEQKDSVDTWMAPPIKQARNYGRIDAYGRPLNPNKPGVPEIPRNRYNEQKDSVDTWMAPPVRKATDAWRNMPDSMVSELADRTADQIINNV